MRKTIALIHSENLIHNYLEIKKHTKVKLIPVVKANSYGHGIANIVSVLENLNENSPEIYAVATLEEALYLREILTNNKDILCFAPFSSKDALLIAKNNITSTLCNLNFLKDSDIDFDNLKFHINIDTGMGRLGLRYDELKNFTEVIKLFSKQIKGLYTHFASSDEKCQEYSYLQLERFNFAIEILKEYLDEELLIHAANSGAIMNLPESYLNAVRPGISLYGYYPSEETKKVIKLKPVMELVSEISDIRIIKKGESVSYGRNYIAESDILTGTVPIGYADGVARNLSGKIKVIINNKEYEQIGRITMDRIVIKVDNNVNIGDKVILFGQFKFTALNWSNYLGTIPYEILCNISSRVPRQII